MMHKFYIVSLPLLIDNFLTRRLRHLRGAVYLISLEEKQIQSFESRLNNLRWLNLTDWFQPLVLFRFETQEQAYKFLDEILLS